MKVQCPNCKKVLSVPDEYKGKRIKCKGCQQVLIAKPTPVVVPIDTLQAAESPKPPAQPKPGPLPSRGNFLTKIWKRSPVAFRTGFLTTLGVVSALTLCIYVYGRIFLPRPSLKSGVPDTELLVPGWEKIKNYEIPPCIALYDYEFEEKWDWLQTFYADKEGFIPIRWHAWYFNSYKHWAKGYYHIEFRNANNSLLIALDPIPTTMVPTGESSDWLPREQTGVYLMPNDIARKVDYSKSRIYLREKINFSP